MFSNYKNQKWPQIIKASILAIVLSVVWMFNSNFITPILLGLILATLTHPLFLLVKKPLQKSRFLKNSLSQFASILTVLITIIVFVIGARAIGVTVIKEAPAFINGISSFNRNISKNDSIMGSLANIGINKDIVEKSSQNLDNQISRFTGNKSDQNSSKLELQDTEIKGLLNIGEKLLGSIFGYLVYLVIMILTWIYALSNYKMWLKTIFDITPFDDQEVNKIQNELLSGVRNVVYANILSGLIHAIACLIIMLIFGVPNVAILTIIIFFIGVLPLSPSELAYLIPLSLILPKNPIMVLVLVPIAESIILWVNYVLIPKIISSDQHSNPLFILTSILSGIAIFGIMGFIIGPLIMIFANTLYTILSNRIKSEKDLL